jgi:hypothetical protein
MQGFRVTIEALELEYPRTPTLVGKRSHTKLFVEVTGKFNRDLASTWARYGRSCDSDVQVALAIPKRPGVSQGDMEYGKANKIGIYTVDVNGNVTEILSAIDLGLRVELPELKTLPPAVRSIAAPFYAKFERGDWRDGFAEACLAVEQKARRYLKARISKPGVNVLGRNGKRLNLKAAQIDKSTLGQLGQFFLGITSPNSIDSLLAKSLPTINPERIVAVHRRGSAATERKLRARTGQRMYLILNCLRKLS